MGRFSTQFSPPPVRIARANARVQQSQMLFDAQRTATGAGQYGQKEARFSSIPIRLRVQKSAGPNTALARAAAIPIGHTRRKRGFPPIVTPPTGG